MVAVRLGHCWLVVLAACMLALCWLAAETSAQPAGEKERILNELDLMDDDGSVETALMNYLFAKQMVSKLRKEMDVTDLQRKRSYWKQCAFNAVSCFG
ncbi:Allatostain CC2 [Frankliniella occidentalis]|uniref:Prohormone-1-like isoform X2 n=1 Tax=Frankliniella occidentalis TaxID=133901 RepID=A0A9C6U8C8_FRAOC|nr:prohormone-1-like isoform X2 [Frankliniella occidentalis]KAE8745335.1 Allatostain CC2 [Frankliniella occidentalis]